MSDSATTPSVIGSSGRHELQLTDIQQLLGPETCLVISSPNVRAGGLFAVSRGAWEVMDTVPSVGLDYDGTRIVRAMYSTLGEPAHLDEIMWYDSRGMVRCERIDGVYGLHDVRFDPVDPDAIVFVSTGTNGVYRHRSGRPLEVVLRRGAVGDAGHRNCLRHHAGLTYLTAFSTMASRREWNREGDRDTGVLIEVETQRVVIEGLCRPHTPLRDRDDTGWVIANSGRGELIWVSDDGSRATLTTGGWPQDIIRVGNHLVVGVVPVRPNTPGASAIRTETARLMVIEEASRTIVGECPIPLPGLYDMTVVPERMADGLRIGTATNVVRLLDRSIRGAMAAAIDIADDNGPEDLVGDVSVMRAPSSVVLGDDVVINVRAVYRGLNRGKTFGDKAIRLGTRWLETGTEDRHVFQSVLAPHQALDVELVLLSPPSVGVHTLEIGFLQESVAWFGPRATVTVDVVAAPTPPDRALADADDVAAGLLDAPARRQRKIADVAAVADWWHSVDLGDGVVTPGHKTPELIAQEWEDLHLPSLAGMSVLDIGAWDGYFSFAAERAGAARVVAVDDFLWALRRDRIDAFLAQARSTGQARTRLRDNPELWDFDTLPGRAGFDLCHRHLSSKVDPVVANYMDLDPDEFGTFDIVLYLGVLYHEPNPLASLEVVRSLTRRLAVVETSALYVPGLEDRALAEFYPDDELNGDATNWWSPNALAVQGMAAAVGFTRTSIVKSHPPEWEQLPAGFPPQLYRLMLHCHVD